MKKSVCFAALTTGTMLAGTGVATAQAGPPPADRYTVHPHTVLTGESLSTISMVELGTTDRWGEIFALNRTTLASPQVIRVGQVLDVPPAVEPPPAVPAPEATPRPEPAPARPYTVAPGESLSAIAQTELGTPERWVEIYALNRATIAAPDLLHVGQVVDIPGAPVDVPADLLASLATARIPVPSASSSSAPGGTVSAQATPSAGGGTGKLAAIRACESSGNYGAVSADGLYRGAYQFDRQTWASVGGSGDPAAASPLEQDARAAQLWNQRGSNPWPNCG